ncbi:MAG: hypothetical protein KDJ15_04475 [Alphaproteobacteria bacterium]|nr:hypothetical protein [Alphaproteobacteria bacterium]
MIIASKSLALFVDGVYAAHGSPQTSRTSFSRVSGVHQTPHDPASLHAQAAQMPSLRHGA